MPFTRPLDRIAHIIAETIGVESEMKGKFAFFSWRRKNGVFVELKVSHRERNSFFVKTSLYDPKVMFRRMVKNTVIRLDEDWTGAMLKDLWNGFTFLSVVAGTTYEKLFMGDRHRYNYFFLRLRACKNREEFTEFLSYFIKTMREEIKLLDRHRKTIDQIGRVHGIKPDSYDRLKITLEAASEMV